MRDIVNKFTVQYTVHKHLRGLHNQKLHGRRGLSVHDIAMDLKATAIKKDNEITPHMVSISKILGLEMAGLDFRVKSSDSIERKIQKWSEKDGISPDAVAKMTYDNLRYTILVDDSKTFTEQVKSYIDRMRSKGFELTEGRKFFNENGVYRGYNTRFTDKSGYMFEVQFHTRQSYDIKQNVIHALYEQFRLIIGNTPEKSSLYQAMANAWKDFVTPDNWDQLEGYEVA